MKLKLKVYPTYARRLNSFVREHPERAELVNEAIRLAARRVREEDGLKNVYPVRLECVRLDMETRAALIQLSRASDRAQWIQLSIAFREILRREAIR